MRAGATRKMSRKTRSDATYSGLHTWPLGLKRSRFTSRRGAVKLSGQHGASGLAATLNQHHSFDAAPSPLREACSECTRVPKRQCVMRDPPCQNPNAMLPAMDTDRTRNRGDPKGAVGVLLASLFYHDQSHALSGGLKGNEITDSIFWL